MTQEQVQKVLDELNEVRPEVLNDEAKRLFEAIMKIENERDELRKVIRKQDLEISSLKQIHDYDIKMIEEVKGKAIELYNRIDERNEVIDLMAEQLAGLAIFDIDKDEIIILGDKEEVKQYFGNKVKGKGKNEKI